jgi:hypothetical protein
VTTLIVALALPRLGLVLLAVLVKVMWKVAEPNEALVVTGLGAGGEPDSVGLAAALAAKAVSARASSRRSCTRSPTRRGRRPRRRGRSPTPGRARPAVVVQETAVADLEAARTEKRLQAEVVKPAEAARDARVAAAEAEKRETDSVRRRRPSA